MLYCGVLLVLSVVSLWISSYSLDFKLLFILQSDSLWSQNNQFNGNMNVPTASIPPTQPPQWQQTDGPISMWDIQNPTPPPASQNAIPPQDALNIPPPNTIELEKQDVSIKDLIDESDKKLKKEKSKEAAKEEKKRKEAEDKQAKKDAEEKRKQEQRKQVGTK